MNANVLMIAMEKKEGLWPMLLEEEEEGGPIAMDQHEA